MLASDDLRQLAAQLRAVDENLGVGSVIVTLDRVDNGTWDGGRQPQVEVRKNPDITDQAAAHLWFDHLERFF